MVPKRFTPSTSALVLIDHQSGTLQLVKTLDVERVKRHTLALARAASILKLPVVLTSSMEEYIQGPLLPEFAKLLPEAFAKRVKRAGMPGTTPLLGLPLPRRGDVSSSWVE
jgi:nicotinamidase-related amidase